MSLLHRIRAQHSHLRILMICMVFLAVQISGAHAHHHVWVSPELSAQHAAHAEAWEFHQGDANAHEHLANADGLDERTHADVERHVWTDGLGKNTKFNPLHLMALAEWLWQPSAAPLDLKTRQRTPLLGPQPQHLRPPSCGPPNTFIA
jgi:hypothetical protein